MFDVPAEVIDGKSIALDLRSEIAKAVASLPEAPTLAVVLVGDDPASEVYVRNKIRASEEAGVNSIHRRLPANVEQAELGELIASLNSDVDVDGILLQLPLPGHLDADAAIELISPMKDVDGLTVKSGGALLAGKPGLRPCTPEGCVILAKSVLGADLSGQNVVIIGRSILVGKPAALLFLAENCSVTIAHSRTRDLPTVCRNADILVAAVGQPEMVRKDWIKPGATVIDVGINRVAAPEKGDSKTKLVGDVAFDECTDPAAFITPVPGGVGPMTIACLLRNTVLAACLRRSWAIPAGI